jgi:hypothetical protein
MNRVIFIAALIWVFHPSSSLAQTTVTLEPATARFAYFAAAEGSGIPGGVPNNYELHFGIQGTFTIQELAGNQGDVTAADFVLLGNDAAFLNDPAGRAQVEAFARSLLLDSMFSVERGPPLDRTIFRAEFDGFGPDLEIEFFRQSLVRMAGGPDALIIDGPGGRFSYPIPEPATVAWLLSACFCAVLCRVVRITRGSFPIPHTCNSHLRSKSP